MELVELKCKNCGAQLKINKDFRITACDYCNTVYYIKNNEKLVELEETQLVSV